MQLDVVLLLVEIHIMLFVIMHLVNTAFQLHSQEALHAQTAVKVYV